MRLLLWCALVDWLGIFRMMRTMFGKDMVSRNQYCNLSFVSRIKRKIFCIAHKGEKQIQILDGY
jgi:hypothetical protein